MEVLVVLLGIGICPCVSRGHIAILFATFGTYCLAYASCGAAGMVAFGDDLAYIVEVNFGALTGNREQLIVQDSNIARITIIRAIVAIQITGAVIGPSIVILGYQFQGSDLGRAGVSAAGINSIQISTLRCLQHPLVTGLGNFPNHIISDFAGDEIILNCNLSCFQTGVVGTIVRCGASCSCHRKLIDYDNILLTILESFDFPDFFCTANRTNTIYNVVGCGDRQFISCYGFSTRFILEVLAALCAGPVFLHASLSTGRILLLNIGQLMLAVVHKLVQADILFIRRLISPTGTIVIEVVLAATTSLNLDGEVIIVISYVKGPVTVGTQVPFRIGITQLVTNIAGNVTLGSAGNGPFSQRDVRGQSIAAERNRLRRDLAVLVHQSNSIAITNDNILIASLNRSNQLIGISSLSTAARTGATTGLAGGFTSAGIGNQFNLSCVT